jgi:hypothetical protein
MLLDDINAVVSALPARLQEKNGKYSFQFVIAERKVFLSTKKLIYNAAFRIDEISGEVRFTEMLKESGAGVYAGDSNVGISPGMGFKVETYTIGGKQREGNIAEQSVLFGKKYNYSFDYSRVRREIEAAAAKAGYAFKYQITSIGL